MQPGFLVYRNSFASAMFEVLDCPLMFLSSLARRKRTQIPALARLFVHFARVNTKFTGFEFANHEA